MKISVCSSLLLVFGVALGTSSSVLADDGRVDSFTDKDKILSLENEELPNQLQTSRNLLFANLFSIPFCVSRSEDRFETETVGLFQWFWFVFILRRSQGRCSAETCGAFCPLGLALVDDGNLCRCNSAEVKALLDDPDVMLVTEQTSELLRLEVLAGQVSAVLTSTSISFETPDSSYEYSFVGPSSRVTPRLAKTLAVYWMHQAFPYVLEEQERSRQRRLTFSGVQKKADLAMHRRLDNPGCDLWPDTSCNLGCCAVHDRCFDDNGCTAKSWISDEGAACDKCNSVVLDCIKNDCPPEDCYDNICDISFDCPGVCRFFAWSDVGCCGCQHPGAACTPALTEPPTPPPVAPPPFSGPGFVSGVFGDPHLSTFDGLRFDCQAVGEFTTVTSLETPEFRIQERFTSVGMSVCAQTSISTGVAIKDVGLPIVQLSIPQGENINASMIGTCPLDLFVDGSPTAFATAGQTEVASGIQLTVSGIRLVLLHSVSGVELRLSVRRSLGWGCNFQVQVFLPSSYRLGESIIGLLGTPNGRRSDDWVASDGSTIATPVETGQSIFEPSYVYCVEQWCITDVSQSMFTYRNDETFTSISQCDRAFEIDLPGLLAAAPTAIAELCEGSVVCLVDGVCGAIEDARAALRDENEVETAQAIVREGGPVTNAGTDFWFAELPSFQCGSSTDDFVLVIANPSRVVASGVIEHVATLTNRTFVIEPGDLVTEFYSTRATSGSGVFTQPVYRIDSDEPVLAFAFLQYGTFAMAATLLLPVSALGQQYRAGSYVNPRGNSLASLFGALAVEDDTEIRVFTDNGVQLGEPITLNQGEYYQREQVTDLTGYVIESTKPVSAFSGNFCTSVGTSTVACDALYEHIIPNESLSPNYVACPSNTRPLGCVDSTCAPDIFRYLALQNDTIIELSGTTIDETKELAAGEFFELSTSEPHVVRANKPISVFQYMISQGSGFPVAVIGDPDLTQMLPVELFSSTFTFLTPLDASDNFLHIVAPNTAIVTVNGATLLDDSCNVAGTVEGTDYCCYIQRAGSGVQNIASDSPIGLQVTGLYGSGAGSYAYNGGTSF